MKEPDHGDPRMLRARYERPRCCATDKRYEIAPLHEPSTLRLHPITSLTESEGVHHSKFGGQCPSRVKPRPRLVGSYVSSRQHRTNRCVGIWPAVCQDRTRALHKTAVL